MAEIFWLDILRSYTDGNGASSSPVVLPNELGGEPVPPPSEDVYAIDQLENQTLPRAIIKRKRQTDPKPKRKSTIFMEEGSFDHTVDQNLPVQGFEYTSVEEDNARFLRRLAKINQTSEAHGNLFPDQAEVLQYIESLRPEDAPSWYQKAIDGLAKASQRYPAQPVLCREYIKAYLREARGDERPCNHPNCQSQEMGGFKCRELVLPGDKLRRGVRGWCYICHLYEANRLYWESLNTPAEGKIFSVHYFTVFTDRPGEYRLDKTIQGDGGVSGIFGPFPIFNVHNYAKVSVGNGKHGWRECDTLLFRLPSETSGPTGFFPTTQPEKERR